MYLNTSSIDEIVFKTNLLNKQVMETVERRKQRTSGPTIQQGKIPRPPPAGSFMASRQLPRTPSKKPTSLQFIHSNKMEHGSPIINMEQEIRDIKEELKLINRNMEQIINRLNQL